MRARRGSTWHALRQIDGEVDGFHALDGEGLLDDTLGNFEDSEERLVLPHTLQQSYDSHQTPSYLIRETLTLKKFSPVKLYSKASMKC